MTLDTRTLITSCLAAIAVTLGALGALSNELTIMVVAVPFALAAAYIQIYYKRN